SRVRSRTRWLVAAGAFLACVAVGSGWWAFTVARRLDRQLVERFEGKRWEIPSKIYSDSFTVYAGGQVSPFALVERLDRLDSRRVEAEVSRAGEYRYQPSERRLEVYLRNFAYPSGMFSGFAARMEVLGETVASITRLDTGQPLDSLEFEPETLAGIYDEAAE